MLDTLGILRRIVQKVNYASDLKAALSLVVKEVKETTQTDACSIYLVDYEAEECVLIAAEGLNRDQIGRFRVKLGEGLVGLVIEKGEAINMESAVDHPRYRLCLELNEEIYHAYLGVPIIHQRRVLGVLIVQQQETRLFDAEEESFLITLSAQLSGTIAHALASGFLSSGSLERSSKQNQEHIIKAIPASSGIAMGQGIIVYSLAELTDVPDRETKDIEGEIDLLKQALAATEADMRRHAKMLAKSLSDEQQLLFEAYIKLLNSESLVKKIIDEIRQGSWAQGALRRVISQHISEFESLDDAYLRDRASDFRHLGQEILAHLQKIDRQPINYPEQSILLGEDINPALLAEIPQNNLVGIVSMTGSSNSHLAVLARALGIPAVMGVSGLSLTELEGQEIIIDGYNGQIYLNLSQPVKEEFYAILQQERSLNAELYSLRNVEAETLDHHRIKLMVNMGVAGDLERALRVGSEGVGLYRTEVLFMLRNRFPTESEQEVIYRQLLQAFAPRPVIVRTLDIGGDKPLPYFPVNETNPFLGWRGIRLTLDHPEIFLVQLRALLKADVGLNNLKILFPMITSMTEVETVIDLINKAYEELKIAGYQVKKPALGAMIEVPSTIYLLDLLAHHLDFLSVGTNDLTQYLLAVDRTNNHVASLYDSLHPAVVRALKQIITAVHKAGKTISVCGEMAGDPAAVLLLIGMGFDSLSMNAASLLRVKYIVRHVTMQKARELVDEVLAMDNAHEIRRHLENALDEAGIGGVIRAGR